MRYGRFTATPLLAKPEDVKGPLTPPVLPTVTPVAPTGGSQVSPVIPETDPRQDEIGHSWLVGPAADRVAEADRLENEALSQVLIRNPLTGA